MRQSRAFFGQRAAVPALPQREQKAGLGLVRFGNAGLAAVVIGSAAFFGTLVVNAADDFGVRDFIRQSARQRVVAQAELPPLFRRSMPTAPIAAPPRRYIGYAPFAVFEEPQRSPSQQTLDLRSKSAAKAAPSRSSQRSIATKMTAVPESKETAGIPRTFSYCVRLCDGFHFPVGTVSAESDMSAHEAACVQACPASPVRLFKAQPGSDGIDDARDANGRRYRDLRAAFSYRSTRDSTCSCNGNGTGVAQRAVSTDFTLRSGDVVMTENGLRVFSGGDKFPYSRNQFASLRGSGQLTAASRQSLERIDAISKPSSPPTSPKAGKEASTHAKQNELSQLKAATRYADDPLGRQIRVVGDATPMLYR
jgi:Protein of unknown function (DUF2865)